MPHGFPPVEEIELRWALRDIRARRFKIAPVSVEEIRRLVDQGFVSMHGDEPRLTDSGLAKLDGS